MVQHTRRYGILALTIGAVSFALATSGCGLKLSTGRTVASVQGQGQDIFSDRPIHPQETLVTVSLNAPALLTVAQKTKNGLEIPKEAVDAVTAAQSALIAQVKNLDPQAKVIYKYRLVLDAVTFQAEEDLVEKLKGLDGVQTVEKVHQLARAKDVPAENAESEDNAPLGPVTSVNFIGTETAQKGLGLLGDGMKVGIIDTGIDYTHAMLGGTGNPADYKNTDPSKPSALFPSSKVVGGVDLVGTNYNAASEVLAQTIPHPDANPIDEAGHGTHVAGTVAGIGDGIHTYTGVAPHAKLYAIKVFGKEGSTSDAVVIKALEYAADPNGDLDLSDHLDVVNMSLGGNFGTPMILYSEAIRNLSDAGTVVVAAAGNSGPVDFIVGAPSTADDAISVAASVDGQDVNWKFAASQLQFASSTALVKSIEGPITKPVAQADGVQGQLVDIGLADHPLTDDQKKELSGKIALITRGKNPFVDKIKLAVDGGAIGVVMLNNQAGDPIPMGGDGHFDIPGIMVSQDMGTKIHEEMKKAPVSVVFKTGEIISEPNRIDSITDFSSKGPRTEDDLIKPEIAAPGKSVLSAAMGSGNQGVRFDGTSMATPHITGVVALLKEEHPNLSSAEIKALMMNSAKILTDKSASQDYPISLQGAGRVQVDKAVNQDVIVDPAGVSLGLVQVNDATTVHRVLQIKNLSNDAKTLTIQYTGSEAVTYKGPAQVSVPALGTARVAADFIVNSKDAKSWVGELDGRLSVSGAAEPITMPVLAMRANVSHVYHTGYTITDQKLPDGESEADLVLTNNSSRAGLAMMFNLLDTDMRKLIGEPKDFYKSKSCDLRSVGYRVVLKKDATGQMAPYIQFGFQLYDVQTQWLFCELNVQIDANNDGVADQEIAGVSFMDVRGLNQKPFATYVLDAQKARELRLAHEQKVQNGIDDPQLSYASAVTAVGTMVPFPQSTFAMMEAPLTALQFDANKKLRIKVAALSDGDSVFMPDDYLNGDSQSWREISVMPSDMGHWGMPEAVAVAPGQSQTIPMVKGNGSQPLVIYYPVNQTRFDFEMLAPASVPTDRPMLAPASAKN